MSLNVHAFDLAQFGGVLARRENGRKAALELAQALEDAADGALLLNFRDVDVASPPFLDELVNALRAALHRPQGACYVVVVGTNDDVKESLEMVLVRHKMRMVALKENDFELLGGGAHLDETLREAQALGSFTAPELAERLQVRLPALHNRLKALREAGAISQAKDPGAGRGKKKDFQAAPLDEVREQAPPSTLVPA